MNVKRKITIQSVAAFILVLAGIIVLLVSIYLPPQGEIHPSVLFAFAEIMISAGTLMGVDLHFTFQHYLEMLKHSRSDSTDKNSPTTGQRPPAANPESE